MHVAEVLADPIAQELLKAPVPARLAYTALDGAPRVIPIAYWWNGAEIVMSTASTAPKVKALRNDPRVAVTIDVFDGSPRMLQLRGTASLDEVDGVPEEYLMASGKHLDREALARFTSQCEALYERMVRIVLAPDWARIFDFQVRAPEVLNELAEKASERDG
jgi:hypothetical protein